MKKTQKKRTGKNSGSGRARAPVELQARTSPFVDIFRTTPPLTVCPNFFVLSHANGCSFRPNCAYCYLKSSFWFLRQPRAYSNLDRMEKEILRWIRRDRLESYVLNTGNLCDSLAFEVVRPLIGRLVEIFREEAEAKGRPHTLLLVTKGGHRECAPLFALPPCSRVILSFSINHPEAAERYERGAAPTGDRLDTAAQLKNLGWRLRLRMDPMIQGYAYGAVAREVAAAGPERVTLGCLRAEKSLPRYVENGLFDPLEPPAQDKALARYPRPVRMALYRQAMAGLGPRIEVGLCEETHDVWAELGLNIEGKTCNCGL
jgi:spore photoproduct lyase